MTRIILAGISGRVGRGLVDAIAHETDLTIVAGVSRTAPTTPAIPIFPKIADAFTVDADVVIDFTRTDIVKSHVVAAIQKGLHVVIGTSGLTN